MCLIHAAQKKPLWMKQNMRLYSVCRFSYSSLISTPGQPLALACICLETSLSMLSLSKPTNHAPKTEEMPEEGISLPM